VEIHPVRLKTISGLLQGYVSAEHVGWLVAARAYFPSLEGKVKYAVRIGHRKRVMLSAGHRVSARRLLRARSGRHAKQYEETRAKDQCAHL